MNGSPKQNKNANLSFFKYLIGFVLLGTTLFFVCKQWKQSSWKKKQNEARFDTRTAVLLGCPVRKDGSLSSTQIKRCELAIDQFDRGNYDTLLICGGETRKGAVEAEVMRDYILKKRPIPILLETESKNTWQNFENAKKILHERPVLVLTSSAHAPRSYLIARNFFDEVRMAVYPEWRAKHLLREIPSLSLYFWLETRKKLESLASFIRS